MRVRRTALSPDSGGTRQGRTNSSDRCCSGFKTTMEPLLRSDKRAMIKVKHARTADCVVAGFRWHKAGKDELVGSLLLGLYDDHGALHHVGVTSSFTMARRRELAIELEPLRAHAIDAHPWREWAQVESAGTTRMP